MMTTETISTTGHIDSWTGWEVARHPCGAQVKFLRLSPQRASNLARRFGMSRLPRMGYELLLHKIDRAGRMLIRGGLRTRQFLPATTDKLVLVNSSGRYSVELRPDVAMPCSTDLR